LFSFLVLPLHHTTYHWFSLSHLHISTADEGEGKTNCIEVLKRFPHAGEIHRARHMPQNSKMIATIGASGDVLLYHTDQKETAKNGGVVGKCKAHGDEGYGLRWSPCQSGRLVSASNDGSVCFWDASNPSMKMSPVAKLSSSTGSINDVAVSTSNGDLCWTVGEAKRIDAWDARKKNGPIATSENAHDDEIMCIDVSRHKEHLMLTGSADNTIKLWDSRNMKQFIHSMEGVHTDDVTSVRWSPHHASFFMSSGSDRRVNVWDLGRIGQEQNEEDGRDGPPELLFVHGGHTGIVDDISWCMSGNGNDFLIASVADDNIVQCWQMQKNLYAEETEEIDAMELE
jgi:histone-binding protein RBBP4